MRQPSPIKIVLGLFGVIVAVQLVVALLAALRPASPPTLIDPSIFADRRAPVAGPARAPVTIILLSDYACPSCRALHPDLHQLLADDPGVRLVYRDWPIFGAASLRAARLAIASTLQGRHAAFDDALMRHGGQLDGPALRAAAASAGVDWQRLEADLMHDAPAIDALIDDTRRKAMGLGFAGTPVLIIGRYLVVGRQTPHRLRALVRQARGGAGSLSDTSPPPTTGKSPASHR